MASTSNEQVENAKVITSQNRVDDVPEEALTEPVLDLFDNYSHVARDQVKSHILAIRDKAWDIFPWCCVGRCTFVELSVGLAPQYPEVLRRLKAGEKYLDVGCCFGQDIRKLVFDGAPAENLTGTDLEPRFFDLGHDLFDDRASLESKFIATDFLNAKDVSLDHMQSSISIIHASSFFHVFDYAGQVEAAKRCVQLLKPTPGSLIFGRQAARLEAGERDNAVLNRTHFVHNAVSWEAMWEEVGKATGTKWRVEVDMNAESPEWLNSDGRKDRRRMRYACWMM